MSVEVLFKPLSEEAVIPEYKTTGSAGADLYSTEEALLEVGSIVAVGLGFSVSVPIDYEMQIRPRSGLALNHGITVLNSPGTIDSDFRGEVKVILANFGKYPVRVRKGDRIAQCVVSPVPAVSFRTVNELDPTERDAGGFGSTGRK